MFDQFFEFYFSYISSLLYAGVSIIGIFAGLALKGRTRTKGPLLLLLGSSIKIFVGLSFPLSNILNEKLYLDYSLIKNVWFSLNLADISGTALSLFGVALISKDFRALLATQSIKEHHQEN